MQYVEFVQLKCKVLNYKPKLVFCTSKYEVCTQVGVPWRYDAEMGIANSLHPSA